MCFFILWGGINLKVGETSDYLGRRKRGKKGIGWIGMEIIYDFNFMEKLSGYIDFDDEGWSDRVLCRCSDLSD